MTKSTTKQDSKPTFREWYEKKYGKLPLYLENAQKKARMAEYEADTAVIKTTKDLFDTIGRILK